LRAIRKNGKFQGGCRDHTDRLAKQEDGLAGAIAFENLSLDAARPFGHVIHVVGVKTTSTRAGQHLALLFGDHAGERFDVFADLGGNRAQRLGAFDGRPFAPAALGRLRRRDGRVRVGPVAIRHGADRLPVEGLVTSMRSVPLEGTNLPSMKLW